MLAISFQRVFFSSMKKFLICFWVSLSIFPQIDASLAKGKLKVFIFAGQSNMVGSDSNTKDIDNFPPFVGYGKEQEKNMFYYSIGRERKFESNGWEPLKPINNVVGPEISFARRVSSSINEPVAIIKCAAGGTHLGGDWNPDNPSGFKMYPLALKLVKEALSELKRKNIEYNLEGFMWHQGENDMFNEEYMKNYGANLQNFLNRWRKDLGVPNLKFYIGELCTKTIWGMDLRPRMYAISKGQRQVTESDELAEYVPTAHIGVEIGGGVGLHYHYGTLGQLQHGVNYADAYLGFIDKAESDSRELVKWPYPKNRVVRLFIMAGHRNMEGERAFTQDLKKIKGGELLLKDNQTVAYKYNLGGGYKVSKSWEPLGPVDYYNNFGPELSFGSFLYKKDIRDFAIAKFTHSGSQIIDWTPEGSMAKSRNLYNKFISFVKESIDEIRDKGNEVILEGVFYHIGENDMSFGPHRNNAPKWIKSIIEKSRKDLGNEKLNWYLSQQPPTDDKSVNKIDVVSEIEKMVEDDDYLFHVKAFDLVPQAKKLVISTEGVVQLGEILGDYYLRRTQ